MPHRRYSVPALALSAFFAWSGVAGAQPPPPPVGGLEAWAEPMYAALENTSFRAYAVADQQGSGHTLTINQAAAGGAGQANLVLAQQQGSNNTLSITQGSGGGNFAQVQQQASGNIASIEQSFDDVATLGQYGNDNTATIVEAGGNNTVTAHQYNNNNTLVVTLTGGLKYEIVQNGGSAVVVNSP